MLTPTYGAEEGSPTFHPRMPRTALGDDEVSALKLFLHSLEPSDARR